MKKITTILSVSLIIFTCTFAAKAQVSGMNASEFSIKPPGTATIRGKDGSSWTKGGVAGLTLSQATLSNWAAGGMSTASFDALFNYNLNYKKNRHLWQNRLELAYGMTYSEANGNQKTNDRIYLASMYSYELGRNWFASALMNFDTQFANGYDYTVTPKRYMSRFMAPGYLSAGLGFTWHPRTWFTATFSPAMWRGTFVLDDNLSNAGMFGVTPGKHFRNEFGANIRMEVNYDIAKGVNLYSRLDLFSNYLKNPQNVDVRWDLAVTAAITKWLSANFTINMIYDDDVKFPRSDGSMGIPKLQIREILGIGLQTSF